MRVELVALVLMLLSLSWKILLMVIGSEFVFLGVDKKVGLRQETLKEFLIK